MTRRIVFFIICASIYSFNTHAKDKTLSIKLVPDACIITGEVEGQVTSRDGSKDVEVCTKKDSSLSCSLTDGKPTSYTIVLDGEGLFAARSGSGNVFMLADMEKKNFSIASSHFVVEKGMLMTKHCAGKIKLL